MTKTKPLLIDAIKSERYLSPALRYSKVMSPTVSLTGVQKLIHDRIWSVLLDGKLPPGTKLPEEQIGKIFKVSRSVVRRVLIVMEQEGAIFLPLNRGAYVNTLTQEKILDVIEESTKPASLEHNSGDLCSILAEGLDLTGITRNKTNALK